MKKIVLSLLCLSVWFGFSQEYQFQDLSQIKGTPVISQDKTGTCWSFATTSFIESEIIRISGETIDLSEMYNVRNTYIDKAENYIMRQGAAQFSQGGLAHDVINSIARYGLVPSEVFRGKDSETDKHDHTEMEAALKALLDSYIKNKMLSPKWRQSVNSLLDIYIGNNPKEFVYKGKKYTPKTFLTFTKINPNDYVSLTSFTHQPFYTSFVLNIPDNFSNGSFFNLPLEELIENMDYALSKGYTIAFDCDVSEVGFSAKEGIAVLPENTDDKTKLFLREIQPEKIVTQEFRQQEFENYNTQDDHLMHIVGKVKDQKGNQYFVVKNSWGNDSQRVGNNGYIYMSMAYAKLKTIGVMMHKDALMTKTKNKLNH